MADVIKSLFDICFEILGFEIDLSNIVPTVRSLCDFDTIMQSDIWFIAEKINTLLVPVGYSLLALFFYMELIRKAMEVDRLSWERVVMTGVKFYIMLTLIQHSFALLSLIMNIGNDILLSVTTAITNDTGMQSLGDTMYTIVDEAEGFLMDIVVGLLIIILYIPFIGTLLGALGQVFLRIVKIVIAFSVSPIPFAIAMYEGLQHLAIKFCMIIAALSLEGVVAVICVVIYSLAVGSVKISGGMDLGGAVSTMLGMLLANGLLMASISAGSSYIERFTGGQ